jgi:hypothetical protein
MFVVSAGLLVLAWPSSAHARAKQGDRKIQGCQEVFTIVSSGNVATNEQD